MPVPTARTIHETATAALAGAAQSVCDRETGGCARTPRGEAALAARCSMDCGGLLRPATAQYCPKRAAWRSASMATAVTGFCSRFGTYLDGCVLYDAAQ